IRNAPGFLRIDEPFVNTTRIPDRLLDGSLGDLIECDPSGVLQIQRLTHVPRDRLPFPIGVGSEVDSVGLLRRCSKLLHYLFAIFEDHVSRLEIVVDINTEAEGRQISDMSDRSL